MSEFDAGWRSGFMCLQAEPSPESHDPAPSYFGPAAGAQPQLPASQGTERQLSDPNFGLPEASVTLALMLRPLPAKAMTWGSTLAARSGTLGTLAAVGVGLAAAYVLASADAPGGKPKATPAQPNDNSSEPARASGHTPDDKPAAEPAAAPPEQAEADAGAAALSMTERKEAAKPKQQAMLRNIEAYPAGSEPTPREVALKIDKAMDAAGMKAGDLLPTGPELQKHLNITLRQLGKAIAFLEAAGMKIDSFGKLGRVIVEMPGELPPDPMDAKLAGIDKMLEKLEPYEPGHKPNSLEVAARIRSAMFAAGLEVGDAMPTKARLVDRLGVEEKQVERALEHLRQAGLELALFPNLGMKIKQMPGELPPAPAPVLVAGADAGLDAFPKANIPAQRKPGGTINVAARALCQGITSGRFQKGSVLPLFGELSVKTGIGRATLHSALAPLRRVGISVDVTRIDGQIRHVLTNLPSAPAHETAAALELVLKRRAEYRTDDSMRVWRLNSEALRGKFEIDEDGSEEDVIDADLIGEDWIDVE